MFTATLNSKDQLEITTGSRTIDLKKQPKTPKRKPANKGESDMPKVKDDTTIAAGFFNRPQAAEFLSVSVSQLDKWRSRNEGPIFYKLIGTVLYKKSDLQAWFESCRVRPAVAS